MLFGRVILVVAIATVPFFAAVPDANAQAQITCGAEYTVVRGDSVSAIARRAYGDGELDRFFALNRDRIGPNPNLLEVGTRLRVPCDLERAQRVGLPPIQTESDQVGLPKQSQQQVRVVSGNGRINIVFNKAAAPEFILNTAIIDPLLADISRVTEGRVTFSEPPQVNRSPEAQMALVTTGKVDGAYIFNGYLADTHPLVQVTMNPMMGGTALQTALALWRIHQKHFLAAGTFDDVHLLGFVGAPPAQIWRMTDRTPAQLADAITVPSFDTLGDIKGVRGQPAATPPETLAMAHGAARAVGVWSQARAVTEIDGGVYAPTFSVFISTDKWNQIIPRDRQAIRNLMGESLALRSAAWDAFDDQQKAEMLEQGLKEIEADFALLAELQDRARLRWEDWITVA
ncbi:MAG: LysM peptidoglycan-binding domain-containing protein, partial [Pseudomonadota bacterium]